MILEHVLHHESFFLEKVEIFENRPAPEGKKNEIFEKVNIFKNLENFHREPKISQKSQLKKKIHDEEHALKSLRMNLLRYIFFKIDLVFHCGDDGIKI